MHNRSICRLYDDKGPVSNLFREDWDKNSIISVEVVFI